MWDNLPKAPVTSSGVMWNNGRPPAGISASSANPLYVDAGGNIRAPGGQSAMTFNPSNASAFRMRGLEDSDDQQLAALLRTGALGLGPQPNNLASRGAQRSLADMLAGTYQGG